MAEPPDNNYINAYDYKPYYKRFINKEPSYFNWLPNCIFSGIDTASLQLLEKPPDFFRHVLNFEPRFNSRTKQRPFKATALNPANPFHNEILHLIRNAIIALRLRSAFRRIAHAWIWKRASRHSLQADDIITLSPIEKPIIVMDMISRRRYQFEASSLRQHITAQLSHVNHGFCAAKYPINPYTNMQFSSAQLYVIYHQLLAYKCISGPLVNFYEAKFNLLRYEKIYSNAIEQYNYLNQIKEPTNDEGQRELVEFIDSTSNLLEHEMTEDQIDIFYYACDTVPCHPYLLRWRKLFIIHYFAEDLERTEQYKYLNDVYQTAEQLLHLRATFFAEMSRLKASASK